VSVARNAGATVVEHETNEGKGAAVQTLFQYAAPEAFDSLVLLDGDGQHVPEDIPDVIEPVINGEADIVVGSRYLESGEDDETPRYRRLGQRVLDALTMGSSRVNVTDSQSGFRALSPTAVDELSLSATSFGVESEMISEAAENGLDIQERSIDVRYDGIDGQTQNPLQHGLTVVTFILQLVRDRHPLLFFGVPGLILATVGVLYGANALFVFRDTGQFYPAKVLVSGFATILGTLSIFIGLILNRISNMFDSFDK
jgi:glycosyltransferase involved in cell wall biosynthesis